MSHKKELQPHVLLSLKAANGVATPEHLELLNHPDDHVKKEAMSLMMEIPRDYIKSLIHHDNNDVALHALHHPSVYEPHLIHALEHHNPIVHAAVAGHPKITETVFKKILDTPHIPVETKMHAVSNPECEAHWLPPVLMDALDAEHDDRHRMAIHALFHPLMPQEAVVDFLHQANCPMMQKMAALNVRDPEMVHELLESDKVPLSVKRVLLKSKHFNREDAWKLKDPQVREEAKKVVADE